MVTKDYSKSRMRENRTYGSVRGGQSNLIPSTRLTRLWREGCGGRLRRQFVEKPYNRPYGRGKSGPLWYWRTTFATV